MLGEIYKKGRNLSLCIKWYRFLEKEGWKEAIL
jgi:hypothetical protein